MRTRRNPALTMSQIWRASICLCVAVPSVLRAEPGDEPAAAVYVRHRKAAADASMWAGLPAWMNGAQIFSGADPGDPRPKDVSGREVLFDVRKPATVLLLASWTYDGNRSGGWFEGRSTMEDLVKQGWVPIGEVKRRKKDDSLDDHTIFRRDCKAGESFRFHTRKYNPPYVVLVPRDRLSAVPGSDPVLSASCILPKWAEQKDDQPARWNNGDGAAGTVLLTARDPDLKQQTASWDMLQRELVRQAILLAARDELGVSTRDTMLREAFPDDGRGMAPLEVIAAVSPERELKVTVFRAGSQAWQLVWDHSEVLSADGLVLDHILHRAERLSRNEFPAMLEQAGYEKASVPSPSDAAVDDDTADLLGAFQLVAQFAAVRQLHADIRQQGQSAALLNSLARGYAHLGVLSEELWSPAELVFKARALLYAQRAVRSAESDPEPLLTRAYVWLLCGFHRLAEESVEAADELQAAAGRARLVPSRTQGGNAARREPRPPQPGLRDVLAAGAACDSKQLAELGKSAELRPLVRLLEFQMAEPTQQSVLLNTHCAALLEEQPGSLRPLAALLHHPQMGPRGRAAHEPWDRFPVALYDTLELVPGVPEELLELVEREQKRFQPGIDIVELELRLRVIRALAQAGAPGKDRSEPSLAVLSHLLLDVGFMQLIAVLNYQSSTLGVDVDDIISSHRFLVVGHPYASYLEAYASDPVRVKRGLEVLEQSIDPAGLRSVELFMLHKIYYHHDKKAYAWLIRPLERHRESSVRRLYGSLVNLEKDRYAKERQKVLAELQQHAPEHPLTATMTLRYDWQKAKPHAEKWETRFSNHPLVLLWLSRQYEAEGDLESCERCLRKGLAFSPDSDAYQRLAAMHYRRGDHDAWRQTLEEMFRKTEPDGLEHDYMRVRIAEYLMERQDYKAALPYAETAAESYSGWSLTCLSACLEGLGRLDDSEQVMRAAARRYVSNRLDWLEWCARNGRGDRDTARRATLEYIRTFSDPPQIDEVDTLSRYYLLTGDRDQAFDNYAKHWKAKRVIFMGLMAAVLADELQKDDVRDRLLKEIVAEGRKDQFKEITSLFEVIALIQTGLRSGRIDADRAMEISRAGSPYVEVESQYVLARFLDRHDQSEAAQKTMIAAATHPTAHQCRSLAMIWLRSRNIAFGRPGPYEAPQ